MIYSVTCVTLTHFFSRGTRASRRGTRGRLYGVRSVARARRRRRSPRPLQNAHAGHDRGPRRRRGPLSAQRSHRGRAHIIVSIAATTSSPQASIGSRGASRTAARDDDSAPPPAADATACKPLDHRFGALFRGRRRPQKRSFRRGRCPRPRRRPPQRVARVPTPPPSTETHS